VLTPIWADDPVPQCRRDHAPVPKIGPENMTTAAERTEILVIVRAELSATDVIDMRPVQFQWHMVSDALLAITFPNPAARDRPHFTRLP
jgi:hypothetical protein